MQQLHPTISLHAEAVPLIQDTQWSIEWMIAQNAASALDRIEGLTLAESPRYLEAKTNPCLE